LIITTSCLLDLKRHNNSHSDSEMLYLLFKTINNLCDYPMVAIDKYHPSLDHDFKLTFDCQPTFLTPRTDYSQGDFCCFTILYIIVIGRVSLTKILLTLQFIISLLVCRRLLKRPFGV
jgi:hypothetical protein